MCFKVFFDKFLKWIDKIWAHFYRSNISNSNISNLTYIKGNDNENCTFNENISYQRMVLTKIFQNQNLDSFSQNVKV